MVLCKLKRSRCQQQTATGLGVDKFVDQDIIDVSGPSHQFKLAFGRLVGKID
jgi:hypothetical protein